jgi:hypothetical protein
MLSQQTQRISATPFPAVTQIEIAFSKIKIAIPPIVYIRSEETAFWNNFVGHKMY